MGDTLYIFIDESGNFDFSANGTKFFVLTSISTTDPIKQRKLLNELRYKMLRQGEDQEFFHATEDKQHIRNEVFQIIQNDLNDISIDSIIAQKNKAHSSLYKKPKYDKKGNLTYINEPDEFFRLVCQTLLRYIFQRYKGKNLNSVVVVLSSLFTKKRCKLITKTLKTYLKNYTSYPFYIYFHQNQADINSQIADYCGWAIYVKHERSEMRPCSHISAKTRSEFDIFQKGTTLWYQYK